MVKHDPELIEKFDGIDIECFETDTALVVSFCSINRTQIMKEKLKSYTIIPKSINMKKVKYN